MATKAQAAEVVSGEWTIEQFNFNGASVTLVQKDEKGMQIGREDLNLQNVNLNFNDKRGFASQIKEKPWSKDLAERLIAEMINQPAPDFTEVDATAKALTDVVTAKKSPKE